ncbi:hypothetical protein [Bradyrhizobium sp. USDA 327]|uniref:hypothetical protein n=1 Tax=Bradyrhizobium sp. USDA 327 TaxID=3156308 RepID=UPI00351820AF
MTIQIEKAGLASRSAAIVGSATLAMALSTTAMMMPSAIVSTAWLRCGCGRPSACSMVVDDIVKRACSRRGCWSATWSDP